MQSDLRGKSSLHNLDKINLDYDAEPNIDESGTNPCTETMKLEQGDGDDCPEKPSNIKSDVERPDPLLEWCHIDSDTEMENMGLLHKYVKFSNESCIETLSCEDNRKEDCAEVPLSRKLKGSEPYRNMSQSGDQEPERDNAKETIYAHSFSGTSTKSCIGEMKPEEREINICLENKMGFHCQRSDGEEGTIGVPNVGGHSAEHREKGLREDVSEKSVAGSNEDSADEMEKIERSLTGMSFTCAEFNTRRPDPQPNIYESGASPNIETPRLDQSKGEDCPEDLLCMSSGGSDVESDTVRTKNIHRSSAELNVDTINFQSNEDGDSSVPSLEWSSDNDSEKFGLHVFIKTSTKSCIRTLRCTDNKKEDCADERQESIGKRIYETSTEACIRSLTTEDSETVDLPETFSETLLSISSEESDVRDFSPAISDYDSDSFGLHAIIETSTNSCMKTRRREADGKDDCAQDEQGSTDKCIYRTSTEDCIKTLTTADSERNDLSKKNPANLSNEDSDSSEATMEWSPVNSDNDSENFGLHLFIKTSTKSCIRTLRGDNNGKEDCADDKRESISEHIQRSSTGSCEKSMKPEDNEKGDCPENNMERHDAEPNTYESGASPYIETPRLDQSKGEDWPENLLCMSSEESDVESDTVGTKKIYKSSAELNVDTINFQSNEDSDSSVPSLEWSSDNDSENFGLHVFNKTSTKSCHRTLRCTDNKKEDCADERQESIGKRIYKTSTEACIRSLTTEDSETADLPETFSETLLSISSEESDVRDFSPAISDYGLDTFGLHAFIETSTNSCMKTLRREDDGKDDCAQDEQGSTDKCIYRTSTEDCIKTLTTADSKRNDISEKNPENLSNEDSDSSEATMEWSPVNSDSDLENFGLHAFIKISTKSCIRTLRCDNNGKEDCADDKKESISEHIHRSSTESCEKIMKPEDNKIVDMDRKDEVETIERPLTEIPFTDAEFNSRHQNAEPRIGESGTNPSIKTFIDTTNSQTHTGADSIKTPLESSPLKSAEEGENSGLHVFIKTSTKSCIKTLRSEEDLEVEMLTRKFEERGDESIAERSHRNNTISEDSGEKDRPGNFFFRRIEESDNEESSTQHFEKALNPKDYMKGNMSEKLSAESYENIEDEVEVIRRLLNEMPLPCTEFYSGRKFHGTSTKQCIKTLKPKHGTRKPKVTTSEPKDKTLKPDGDTERPDSDKFKTVIERWYANRSVNRTEEDKENVQLLWHERADGSLKCLVTDNCSYVSRTRQDLTTHVYNDHSSKHCIIA